MENIRNLIVEGCFNKECIRERAKIGGLLHWISGRRGLKSKNKKKLLIFFKDLYKEIGVALTKDDLDDGFAVKFLSKIPSPIQEPIQQQPEKRPGDEIEQNKEAEEWWSSIPDDTQEGKILIRVLKLLRDSTFDMKILEHGLTQLEDR